MTVLNILKLLKIANTNSLTFTLERPVRLAHFEKMFRDWEKVVDEKDKEFGNFLVVYRKGTYEVELINDEDAYVLKFTISKDRVQEL